MTTNLSYKQTSDIPKHKQKIVIINVEVRWLVWLVYGA